jgi:hypothetical protein
LDNMQSYLAAQFLPDPLARLINKVDTQAVSP